MKTQLAARPAAITLGHIFEHRLFGFCKVVKLHGRAIEVQFCDLGNRQLYSLSALEGPDFKRATLHTGALATGPDGRCIVKGLLAGNGSPTRIYKIVYQGGLNATASEVELVPLSASAIDGLPERLLQGRTAPYSLFAARHRLLLALARFNRQVGGLRALLASRIDLHPHQAFVAGTVILDPVRRYILADEVGLGKTIEAGIVIHDLLSRRPDARILVLTPGPLTRQWLSEMHGGFGGQGFKLADLHPIESVDLKNWTKVICSTNYALDGLDEELLAVTWDMVVVDEVHHLLGASHLYDLVMELSRQTPDLLLLSAVPVRRREEELYRLLALLDPQTYRAGGTSEPAFLEIYNAQEALGRRLNLLSHDLSDLKLGEASDNDVISRLERLCSLPILATDQELGKLLEKARDDPTQVAAIGGEVHSLVTDRYRVNRRILRNRKVRLISQERLTAIARRPALLRYDPDQIEAEAVTSVEALLDALASNLELEADILRPFARILLQALVDPHATLDVLTALKNVTAATVNSYGVEMLNAVTGLGGERWRIQLETSAAGVKRRVDPRLLENAIELALSWRLSQSSSTRWEAIASFLGGEIEAGRKTLVFAGFPGVAQRLAIFLKEKFHDNSVTEFRSNQDDISKEESVLRFRTDMGVMVMVSDESGGEGRNFQFAHSLVHADLPWQPSVIEQRIGRLDRLGRETVSLEVTSNVCVRTGSWEAGLYGCYHEGLNLFSSSVSGLEFALRHLQDEIIDAALRDGETAMYELAPRLTVMASDERIRDDSDALLDEGSYHAAKADRFVRTPSASNEMALELAFLDYFRGISIGKGVSKHHNSDESDGIWCFRPENVPHGEIVIAGKDAAGESGKRIGTFRRETARRQRNAEFFSYGNPLFDAVVESLEHRLTGRTYAIACKAPAAPSFIGLELVLAARPSVETGEISPSLLNLADSIFATQRRQLFIPLLQGQPVNAPLLADLLLKLTTKSINARWQDIKADEVQKLVQCFDGDLEACIKRATVNLIPAAKQNFAKALAEPLAAEYERIDVQRSHLKRLPASAAASEEAMLDRYSQFISNWEVVVDGLGFLALNAVT
ncbi:hypothetical protein HFO17_12020 [Rhizobium laguerreae]|uniref:SNF2-related protein n=1 Tax=Rhizobium laguerreae TaxID=1076926 RepID=UPI001C92571F|nr:SNF2-related protein [Rhizobium laguerreae]MBY3235263.1 hypothetical protein [Rhizobium laguerreae]